MARVKQIREEVAALKELCRNLFTQKQVTLPRTLNPKPVASISASSRD